MKMPPLKLQLSQAKAKKKIKKTDLFEEEEKKQSAVDP